MNTDRWTWLGSGGGETARLMREVDWASTAVGPVESWSPSLRAIVAAMVHARHPMFLWWGPELVQFYNDGYVPSFGVGRHPAAMGQRGQECWAEIWPIIGPEIESVIATRQGTFHEDALVPIFRNGGMEEVYWTYGYSPVFESDGSVAGVLVIVTETTSRVVALRRLRMGRALANSISGVERYEDLARAAIDALEGGREDVPWALVCRAALARDWKPLTVTSGLGQAAAEAMSELVGRHLSGAISQRLDPIDVSAIGELPGGPWPEAATRALCMPIQGNDDTEPFAHLVIGLSPRLPFDDAYADHARGLRRQLANAAQRIDSQRDLERTAHERERLVGELETASRAKDEFLAMMGHELRNPLAPIVAALELMRQRGDDETRREQAVIGRQVNHLLRLVDDLLDISRITRGKVELRRTTSDVSAVADHAVEIVTDLFQTRRHQLTIQVDPGLRWHGDATRLEQVLANLLTNAARYTEPGGQVSLEVGRDDDDLVLRVRDNGRGIHGELLSRIFEPFVQGDRGPDRREGGLGLGLAVVKGLIALHGGTVQAKSDGPGHGSEFLVRVPGLVSTETPPTSASTPTFLRTAPARSRRVLIVDDNEDAADLLAELLQKRGHEVAVAYEGQAALELVDTFRPEIAFLDIGLPGMDGYELVARLRVRSADWACRYFALTGYGQRSDAERATEAGFDELLIKPVDFSALERILD